MFANQKLQLTAVFSHANTIVSKWRLPSAVTSLDQRDRKNRKTLEHLLLHEHMDAARGTGSTWKNLKPLKPLQLEELNQSMQHLE